jgi:TonB family protein
VTRAVVVVLLFTTLGGCAYFNTFYNARKAFKEGEKTRKSALQQGAAINPGKNSYERAIEKSNKIAEKHPKSKYHDDALFLIGMSYFHIHNFTKSEVAFRELLATHPKSDLAEEAQLYLARCRIELGDEIAGFHAFSELAETARRPEWRAEAIYQRGEHFFRNGMYDSAATAYQRVFAEYKDSERGIASRQRAADALRHLGQYDSAITLYASLIDDKKTPIRFQALRGMGEALYESHRPDSGISIFSAMAESEDYADSIGSVRLLLARGLQDVGDNDGAWRQYDQVAAILEKTKWSAEALFRMAEIKQFKEEDLVRARDLYEKSRLESAIGGLAQVALTRSANITKLEQFRKELGRGELNQSEKSRARGELYDPARLPRLERLVRYSPLEARPADYQIPSPIDSTKLAFGPETPPELVSTASASQTPLEPLGPPSPVMTDTTTIADEPLGPPTSLAPFYGPPFNPADLAYNERISLVLTDAAWLSLIRSDSAFGPPSPAYLYEFGKGGLLGPETPLDTVPAATVTAQADSVALRAKADRDSVRAARVTELEKVKSAANTQMQLAELYRFDLGYPDSSLAEYDNLVERYPTTPYAAKALLGAADVLMESLGDTAAAAARLHRILAEYPYADFAGDAIARLHLEGTPADTAHPLLAYRKAEKAMQDRRNSRQALAQLEEFIDRYPESRLVPNAEFAIVTLKEDHSPVEDSSIIMAYKAIETKYPHTAFATAASEKLTFTVKRPQKRVAPKLEDTTAVGGSKPAGTAAADSLKKEPPLPKAPLKLKVQGPFVYPESEYSTGWKGKVVYKILIDYSGQIGQYELVSASPSSDINEAARKAIEQTMFFQDSIPPESLNMWYRYEIEVIPPAREQDEFDRLGLPHDPQRNP